MVWKTGLVLALALQAEQTSPPSTPEANPPSAPIQAPATAQDPLNFMLVCTGGGSQVVHNLTTAHVWGSGGYANAYAVGSHDRDYGDTATVEITGSLARLRVPETFIPPMHGGGSDGWWVIQNFHVSDTDMSGNVSFNLFDNPAVHINRATGVITINSRHGSFTGNCEKTDPAARKF